MPTFNLFCLFVWFGHLQRRMSESPCQDVLSIHGHTTTRLFLTPMPILSWQHNFLESTESDAKSTWIDDRKITHSSGKYCRGSKLLNFCDQKGTGHWQCTWFLPHLAWALKESKVLIDSARKQHSNVLIKIQLKKIQSKKDKSIAFVKTHVISRKYLNEYQS